MKAMVIPWVLDQTIVAMLSSLLPFYVQRLDRQDGFQSHLAHVAAPSDRHPRSGGM